MLMEEGRFYSTGRSAYELKATNWPVNFNKCVESIRKVLIFLKQKPLRAEKTAELFTTTANVFPLADKTTY